MNRPIVLIHGYSDKGASFRTWREKLGNGDPAWEIDTINTGNYQSLTDEVTIKDLADGLRSPTHRHRQKCTRLDAALPRERVRCVPGMLNSSEVKVLCPT